ncbi:MAG TPA: hypothetical protein VNZ45_01915 [Bacteroidia bacterium]|jgi:hypothetical protein|nr:hypothetical protein [Bacteroidia bacterium]
MSFRLINNRAQDIAVKGFIVTLIVSVILHLLHWLSLSMSLPFVMPWLVVWLIGYSMINKNNNQE